jgi:hypothetical protein
VTNKLIKIYSDKLKRQLDAHPHLQTYDPTATAQDAAWRRFLADAKGKPLYIFDEVEHQRAMKDTDSKCCLLDILGRPQKNGVPSSLFEYQAHVAHKILWPTTPEFSISSFTDPDMIAKVNDNIPTDQNVNRSIALAKSSGLGISYLCLLLGVYKCVVDDKLRGTQFCLVVGPSQNLAVILLNRAKELFQQKLNLQFTTRETIMYLNGVRWEVFPSFNLDSMRSLVSPSYIYVSESSFVSNGREVLDICQRYVSKGNPIILWESTPNKPNDVMDIIFNHQDTLESQSFGTKILLPWQVGMGTIYDEQLIAQQQRTVGWRREYNIEWTGVTGNVFTPESIERASTTEYDLGGIPAASKALGIDSSPGGDSAFSFVLIQTANNKIQVLLSESYRKAEIDFTAMVNRTIEIMKEYQNVRKVYIDSAIPTIWLQVKKALLERTDFQSHVKELQKWGYSEQQIQNKIRVWPTSFNVHHRILLSNLKWIMDCDPAIMQINPDVHKSIIIALQTAVADEFDLEKAPGKSGSYVDEFDAFRLACKFITPQQRITLASQSSQSSSQSQQQQQQQQGVNNNNVPQI